MIAVEFVALVADRQVLRHVGLDAEVQRAEIRHSTRQRNPFPVERCAVFKKKNGRQQQLRGQADHVGRHQRGHHFKDACQYAHAGLKREERFIEFSVHPKEGRRRLVWNV